MTNILVEVQQISLTLIGSASTQKYHNVMEVTLSDILIANFNKLQVIIIIIEIFITGTVAEKPESEASACGNLMSRKGCETDRRKMEKKDSCM
jgi:hypothetical protein